MDPFKSIDPSQFGSLEDLQRQLDGLVRGHNEASMEELGGLSPSQVHALLYEEWNSERSPIRVNDALPPGRYEHSPFFRGVRALLLELQNQGGVKPTQAGNLPRRFVDGLIDAFLDESEKEMLFSMNRVVNEFDVFPLHVARLVAEIGGVIGKSRGKWVVRKKYSELLKPESSGKLFIVLFSTFFRKFNLGYLFPYKWDFSFLQHRVAFPMYRLHSLGSEWIEQANLPKFLLVEDLRLVEQTIDAASYLTAELVVDSYVVRTLEMWGFAEARAKESAPGGQQAYRPTPLFRDLVRFEFK